MNNDLSSDAEATLVPVSLYTTHQTCRLYGGGIQPQPIDKQCKSAKQTWSQCSLNV